MKTETKILFLIQFTVSFPFFLQHYTVSDTYLYLMFAHGVFDHRVLYLSPFRVIGIFPWSILTAGLFAFNIYAIDRLLESEYRKLLRIYFYFYAFVPGSYVNIEITFLFLILETKHGWITFLKPTFWALVFIRMRKKWILPLTALLVLSLIIEPTLPTILYWILYENQSELPWFLFFLRPSPIIGIYEIISRGRDYFSGQGSLVHGGREHARSLHLLYDPGQSRYGYNQSHPESLGIL